MSAATAQEILMEFVLTFHQPAEVFEVNDDSSGGMTLHELAAEYGVSAERIRQIEVAALKKMRKTLEPQRV